MADDGWLRVTRTLRIRLDELVWRATGSGGPGGQHANTANTRVELVFDVAESRSLGPRQRARLLNRVGPTVRVVASDTRSQARNREVALDRLRSKLADGLREARPRVATAPSKSAEARRLAEKHHHADVKRARRKPDLED
jgi:ribosome-associated protein